MAGSPSWLSKHAALKRAGTTKCVMTTGHYEQGRIKDAPEAGLSSVKDSKGRGAVAGLWSVAHLDELKAEVVVTGV